MNTNTTIADDQYRASLKDRGYCIIENALSDNQVNQMRNRLEEQALAEMQQDVTGFGTPEQPEETVTQWVTMLLNKGTCFQDLVLNPPVYELAKEFIGDHCILSDLSARITHPGSQAMGLHTDQWWLPRMAMPGEDYMRVASLTRKDTDGGSVEPATQPINPMVVMTVIYALVDITAEMGPTRFVPGSHLTGRIPDPEAIFDEDVPEVRSGSAVVFDGRIWHGAAPNLSNQSRYTVLLGYTGPQFRPILNYPFGLRPEVADSLSDEMRDVLGYKIWNGYGATNDFTSRHATGGMENTGVLKPDV